MTDNTLRVVAYVDELGKLLHTDTQRLNSDIALTPHAPAQATIDELRAEVERLRKVACAAIEARRRYGWSVEADAAIEALRASLLGDGGTL